MIVTIPTVDSFFKEITAKVVSTPVKKRRGEIGVDEAIVEIIKTIEQTRDGDALDGFSRVPDVDTDEFPPGFYMQTTMAGKMSIRTALRLKYMLALHGWDLTVHVDNNGGHAAAAVFFIQPDMSAIRASR